MKKVPLIFIEHILESINKIESFSSGISKEELSNNELKQYAIIRAIEVIGEACRNLPESLKKEYSFVSWKDIIGTRDKMIHHYFGVDLNIVWDIIKKHTPTLKEQIIKIKKDLETKRGKK